MPLLCPPSLSKKEQLTDREREEMMNTRGSIPQQEDRGVEDNLSAPLHLCRSLSISPHANGCSLPLTLISLPPSLSSLSVSVRTCESVYACMHVCVGEKWCVTDSSRPSTAQNVLGARTGRRQREEAREK